MLWGSTLPAVRSALAHLFMLQGSNLHPAQHALSSDMSACVTEQNSAVRTALTHLFMLQGNTVSAMRALSSDAPLHIAGHHTARHACAQL